MRKPQQKPTRCPACGVLVFEFPEGSQICYGCQIGQRSSGRERSYLREDSPIETIGAITSDPERFAPEQEVA